MNCSQIVGFHTFDQTDSDTLIGKGYNLQDILYYYNIPRTGRKYIKYKYSINEARARSQNFKAMKF